jgi:hypothetical protein
MLVNAILKDSMLFVNNTLYFQNKTPGDTSNINSMYLYQKERNEFYEAYN